MNLSSIHWAGSPLFHLSLLSVGMGLCLYLFITLKKDIFRVEQRNRRCGSGWTDAINHHRDYFESRGKKQKEQIEEIQNDLKDLSDRVGLLTPSAAPSNGINLSKRSQVLQLAKRGSRPDQIAACLQVPQNEVDLVLKVQRTMMRAF